MLAITIVSLRARSRCCAQLRYFATMRCRCCCHADDIRHAIADYAADAAAAATTVPLLLKRRHFLFTLRLCHAAYHDMPADAGERRYAA